MPPTSENPVFPPGIVHPSFRRHSETEFALNARQYGQFKNAYTPPHPHPFPGSSGYVPQQNAWEGTYGFQQRGPLPLQPMQPSVPPARWDELLGAGSGGYHPERPPHHPPHYPPQGPHHLPQGPQHPPQGPHQSENQRPAENQGLLYSHVTAHNHRGQPSQRGQPHHRGQSHRGYPASQRPRVFSEQRPPPQLAFTPPDPDKTPTPQTQRRNTEDAVKEMPIRARLLHAWQDPTEAPQPSGMFVPLLAPGDVNRDLIVKVGDTVRVRPWVHLKTWVEGHVEKADFSFIVNHKPQPRYVVSYTDPESKQLKQRAFRPQFSEILAKDPDEPGLKPVPEGTDRNIYACIPPPVVKNGWPIEMIWAHARMLTPPDANDRINIRILSGPSKNLLFNDFPTKYTLPFCRASRARVTKEGYTVAGNNEHPLEDGDEIC